MHKKQLNKIIEEDFGAPAGLENIEFYQPALNELMKDLPAEELAKAVETAVEWNNQTAPKDVQARYACNFREHGQTHSIIQVHDEKSIPGCEILCRRNVEEGQDPHGDIGRIQRRQGRDIFTNVSPAMI
jgi:hypothetical protein